MQSLLSTGRWVEYGFVQHAYAHRQPDGLA